MYNKKNGAGGGARVSADFIGANFESAGSPLAVPLPELFNLISVALVYERKTFSSFQLNAQLSCLYHLK